MSRFHSVFLAAALFFTSAASAQQFQLPITVADGATTPVVITLGVDPAGTDGNDSGLDALLPPPPPSITSVDARSSLGSFDFSTDIRGNALTEKTFTLKFDAPTVANVTLSWDNSGLAGLGTFEMFDPFGTILVDMTTTGSFAVSSSPFVQLGKSVTIKITPAEPPNNPPVATNGSETVAEDGSVSITLAATDADSDPLTYTVVTGPTYGTLTGTGASRMYTPNANFNGSDSFTFKANDGEDDSNTATVSITVSPVNDAPVAADDTASGNEDTAINVAVLTNDSDVDADALSVTAKTDGTNGTVAIETDGTVTYTPAADFSGSDTFTYTISDGTLTATANVAVTVNPVNDAPVAVDDTGSGNEDTPIAVTVLTNDTDTENDALSVSGTTTPTSGTVAVSGGTVTYTPNQDFSGSDSFDYTVSDGNGGTDTGTVSITVAPVNDNPVAVTDNATTDVGVPVDITPLANDTDVDGDTPTLTGIGTPTHGTATFTGGTVTYTPGGTFTGQDSFSYTIADGNGGTASGTINISALNAVDDVLTVDEDGSGSLDPTANDTDPENDPISVTGVGTPSNGTATASGNTVTYTPNADFNGTDSFTYDIADGTGSSGTGTVTVTVNPANDAPVAVDDTASGNEDGAINVAVLTNDSDIDGDVLSVTAKTDGTNGTVAIETNGTLTYTPAADFSGSDTFTYTISDGTLTATANVAVTVNPVNDAPVAVDDTASGDEDTAINVAVLTNDSDVDGDALTVTAKTDGANGTVAIETNGTVTYTPAADFSGADSFTYTISDGTLTATANVAVTVNPVNDAPVAVDDSGSGNEDTPIAVTVLTNDTDTENDALSVTGTTTPTSGTVAVSGGTITYTPNQDFNGSDSFDYTVSDGNGGTDTGTVSITVAPVNDNPVAVTDNATTDVGVPVDITPLVNDTDVDGDTPTLTGIGTPTHGTATFTGGTVTYTPGGTFTGQDSFSYTIADGNGGTASGTINISALNAVDDVLTVDEDGSGSLDPTANDTDPENDPISVTGVGTPANGTATASGNTVTYTPNADFNGTDSFTYNIADGTGSSGTGTVTVTVSPVNDAPVAVDDAASGDEDTAIGVSPVGNDSDIDGDALTIASFTQPTNGTVTAPAGKTAASPLTYTPNADFNGTDSFTYTVQDPAGLGATATVTVTVNPVNDAPVAVDDTASGNEDTAINVAVLSNDSDVDGDALSVTAKTDGTNGTVVIETDGTVTYTPAADFSGADSFTYTISDGTLTATANVAVTVNPVNDAPVAVDDSGSGNEDTPIAVTVLTNDTDTENDALSVTGTTTPTSGTVAVSGGTVSYTPNQDFNGSDSFDYTVSDGNGGTDTGTVSITVAPVNDNPVAVTDNATTDVGVPVDITPLVNDTDVDGDTPTLTGVGTPTHGTATFTGGTVTYTPGGTFTGQDSFSYTIADGNGGTASGTINISALNAVDDVLTVDEDGSGSLDPTANDTDPENDPISVTGVGTPTNGTATASGNIVTYTPNPDFNGTDSFTYDIADGTGSAATATISVTITSVNDAPVAVSDTASGDEDTAIGLDLRGNDTDVDGDPISITSNTNPTNGTLTTAKAATSKTGIAIDFTYTPNPDFNGTDTFTYTVEDGNGGSATGTVTLTINPVQDAPTASDDSADTSLDRAVDVPVLANDADADNEPLTITVTSQPANGTAAVNDGGTPADPTDDTVTYTPNAGYFNLGEGVNTGPDTFTYSVSDGTDTANATVSVTVLENNPPTVVDDAATTSEDTAVTLTPLADDSDPDNEALTLGTISDPPNGTATANADGSVTYVPDANFNGTDTFTYEAVDERGGTTVGTITIVVTAANDAPRAAPDQATTNKNTAVVIAVLANDSDVDGDKVTLTSVAKATNGTTVANAGGTVTYTPNAGFFGTDTFEYVATDGQLTSRGAVRVTVQNVNLSPTPADDSATTSEDIAVTVNLLANDTDPDGDILTVTTVGTATSGTVFNNLDGTATYTPNAGFNGTDAFTYSVADPQGLTATATVVVTVIAVNDAPVVTDDARKSFEGSTAEYTPLDNDSDPDGDDLSITSVSAAGLGTTSLVDGETVSYVPPTGYNGTDSFTYTVSDGNGGTATGTVTVTVEALPPDDDGVEESTEAAAPNNGDGNGDGVPDSEQANVASLPSASSGSFITVATDTGSELQSVESVATNPTSEDPPAEAEFPAGFLSYNLAGGTGNAKRTVSITLESGEFNSYFKFGPTPDNTTPHWYNFLYDGETGAVISGNTITLHFVDGKRGDDDLAANGIIVDPGAPAMIPNKTPVAVADQVTTDEDNAVTVDVTANDSDEDGDTLIVSSVSRPKNGTRTRTGSQVTYTPNANFNGTDSFTYVVSDGKGGSVTAKVTITVIAVNDPPQAVDDSFTTDEDVTIQISGLRANDTDVESTTLTLVHVQAAQRGLITVSNTGLVTYTPPANESGTDTFTYTVSDGEATSTGTATVTITAVNDAPVANADMVSLESATTVTTIDVLANDTDVEGDALTLTGVGTPGLGTAVVQGTSVVYTPGTGFVNQDTFSYTVTDANGASSEGTVMVTLGAVPPNALADEGTTDEDSGVVIDVRANDSDPNGDSITVTAVGTPAHGTAVVDADGNVVYTPEDDYFGTDTFTYTVSDGTLTSEATVTVTITGVNDAPRFGAGSPVFVSPADGASVAIGSATNDDSVGGGDEVAFEFNGASDPEGTTVTYTWELAATNDFASPLVSQELAETSFSLTVGAIAALIGDEPGATVTVFHRITASDGELDTVSATESASLIRGYVTGVDDEALPEDFELHQNYPNPFNPITTIRFALPQSEEVTIDVFDTAGRQVATLVNGLMPAGYHEVPFNGANLPSGVYLYIMRAGSYSSSRPLVLLK